MLVVPFTKGGWGCHPHPHIGQSVGRICDLFGGIKRNLEAKNCRIDTFSWGVHVKKEATDLKPARHKIWFTLELTPMHIKPDLASHVDIPIDPNKDVLALGRCGNVMAWTRTQMNHTNAHQSRFASHVDIPIDPNKDVLSLGRCMYVMAWTRGSSIKELRIVNVNCVCAHTRWRELRPLYVWRLVGKIKMKCWENVQNGVWKSIIIWFFFWLTKFNTFTSIHLYHNDLFVTYWQFSPIRPEQPILTNLK